jgi:hypothetical protein
MKYITADGFEKSIGDFGTSTQEEFDEALAALPGLIHLAREEDADAGRTANELLWKLANESTSHVRVNAENQAVYSFGKTK